MNVTDRSPAPEDGLTAPGGRPKMSAMITDERRRKAGFSRLLPATRIDGARSGRLARVGRPLRKLVKLLALASALFYGSLALRPSLTQNFGVIEPGRAYRSAQPTSRLADMIREQKLASILNLRGGTTADAWYMDEVRACRAAGVDFFDLPLSAIRRPARRELLLLIDALAAARPPLLIHCRAGADRTGLATVIYSMTALGRPPDEAMAGFTVFRGHFPLFGTQHLHEPIDEYAAWLSDSGRPHSPAEFRRWVLEDYQAPDPHAEPRRIAPGPRDPALRAAG